MLIGVPAASLAAETRVAVAPETVKKPKAQDRALHVESGAGTRRGRWPKTWSNP